MDNPARNQRYPDPRTPIANPAAAKPQPDPTDLKPLPGKTIRPENYMLANGQNLPLADVIHRAGEVSGCATFEEWNALDEETRDQHIDEQVKLLDLFKEPEGEVKPEPAKRGWFGRR